MDNVVWVVLLVAGLVLAALYVGSYLLLLGAVPYYGFRAGARVRRILKQVRAEGLFDEDGYRLLREGQLIAYESSLGDAVYPVLVYDDDAAYSIRVETHRWFGVWRRHGDAYVTGSRTGEDEVIAYLCDRAGNPLPRADVRKHPKAAEWWLEWEGERQRQRRKALRNGECPRCGHLLEQDE